MSVETTHPADELAPDHRAAAAAFAQLHPMPSRAFLEQAIRGGDWQGCRSAVSSARAMDAAGLPLALAMVDRYAAALEAELSEYEAYGAREILLALLVLIEVAERLSRGGTEEAPAADALYRWLVAASSELSIRTLQRVRVVPARGALRVLEVHGQPDERTRSALATFLYAVDADSEDGDTAVTRASAIRLLAALDQRTIADQVRTRLQEQARERMRARSEDEATASPFSDTYAPPIVADAPTVTEGFDSDTLAAPVVPSAESTTIDEPGTSAPAAAPMSLVSRLEFELLAGAEPVRRAVLDILAAGRIPVQPFVPHLRSLLDDDTDRGFHEAHLRATALRLLASVEPLTASMPRIATPAERLEFLVRNDPDGSVREASLQSFVRLAPRSSSVQLCQDALTDAAAAVRRLAACLLSELLENAEPVSEFEFDPFDE